ncbi:MAG: FRG domain-containing protein [Gammaproteobacteria bacterium]
MLYRGLSEAKRKISSSLKRRLRHEEDAKMSRKEFTQEVLQLLNEAEMRGHRQKSGGALMSDLELLAELQHYGAATCLIDFTKMPLVALWFACRPKSESSADGKVVAINAVDGEQYKKIQSGYLEKKIDFWLSPKNKKGNPVDTFWIWEPHHQNRRITAQRSVFVFGKPELPINDNRHICLIAHEKKAAIIDELRRHGISDESLFCDFDGFARLNAHDNPPHRTAKNYFELGRENAAAEKHERAIAYYDLALENEEPYKAAYFDRGWSKLMLKDYKGARADFNESVNIDNKNANAHLYLGLVKFIEGDYPAAIEDLNKIIRLNPQHAPAFYGRGIAKFALGDKAGALADMRRAKEISPEDSRFIIPDALKDGGGGAKKSGGESGGGE